LERLETLDRDALIRIILDQQKMIEELRAEIEQLKRRGSAAPFSNFQRHAQVQSQASGAQAGPELFPLSKGAGTGRRRPTNPRTG
jgi:hypothetical protein